MTNSGLAPGLSGRDARDTVHDGVIRDSISRSGVLGTLLPELESSSQDARLAVLLELAIVSEPELAATLLDRHNDKFSEGAVQRVAESALAADGSSWDNPDHWRLLLKSMQYFPELIETTRVVHQAIKTRFSVSTRGFDVLFAKALARASQYDESFRILVMLSESEDAVYIESRLPAIYECISVTRENANDVAGSVVRSGLPISSGLRADLASLATIDARECLARLECLPTRDEVFLRSVQGGSVEEKLQQIQIRLECATSQGGFASPADAGRGIEACLSLLRDRKISPDQVSTAFNLAFAILKLATNGTHANSRTYSHLARQISRRGNLRDMKRLVALVKWRGEALPEDLVVQIAYCLFNAGNARGTCRLIALRELQHHVKVRPFSLQAARQAPDPYLAESVIRRWLADASLPDHDGPGSGDFRSAVGALSTVSARWAADRVLTWSELGGQFPKAVVASLTTHFREQGDLDGLLSFAKRAREDHRLTASAQDDLYEAVLDWVRLPEDPNLLLRRNVLDYPGRIVLILDSLGTPRTERCVIQILKGLVQVASYWEDSSGVAEATNAGTALVESIATSAERPLGKESRRLAGKLALASARNRHGSSAWRLLASTLNVDQSECPYGPLAFSKLESQRLVELEAAWIQTARADPSVDLEVFKREIHPRFESLRRRYADRLSRVRRRGEDRGWSAWLQELTDAYCQAVPRAAGADALISEAIKFAFGEGVPPLPSSLEAYMATVAGSERVHQMKFCKEMLSDQPFTAGLWTTFVIGALTSQEVREAPGEGIDLLSRYEAVLRGEKIMVDALTHLRSEQNRLSQGDRFFSAGEIDRIVESYPWSEIPSFGPMPSSYRLALRGARTPLDSLRSYVVAAAQAHARSANGEGWASSPDAKERWRDFGLTGLKQVWLLWKAVPELGVPCAELWRANLEVLMAQVADTEVSIGLLEPLLQDAVREPALLSNAHLQRIIAKILVVQGDEQISINCIDQLSQAASTLHPMARQELWNSLAYQAFAAQRSELGTAIKNFITDSELELQFDPRNVPSMVGADDDLGRDDATSPDEAWKTARELFRATWDLIGHHFGGPVATLSNVSRGIQTLPESASSTREDELISVSRARLQRYEAEIGGARRRLKRVVDLVKYSNTVQREAVTAFDLEPMVVGVCEQFASDNDQSPSPLESYYPIDGGSEILVRREGMRDLPQAETDSLVFAIVLEELLNNALKAAASQGIKSTIEVSAHFSGDVARRNGTGHFGSLVLCVKNKGRLIDERVSDPDKGNGLNFARVAMEQLGGDLQARQDGDQVTVLMRIPAASAHADEKKESNLW